MGFLKNLDMPSCSSHNDEQNHLALFNEESNYSKKHPPIGFSCSYTETTITIESEPVSLREAALEAAEASTFKPTTIKGERVRVKGKLTYNFVLK